MRTHGRAVRCEGTTDRLLIRYPHIGQKIKADALVLIAEVAKKGPQTQRLT